MKWTYRLPKRASMLIAALALAGCASMGDSGVQVSMSGAQEVPPVNTAASGSGTVKVGEDRSVSGNFRTQGIAPMAAHIHVGAAGQNGPVIIPLNKTADNEWSVPAGAKLTEEQYQRYQAGGLYVNFHTPQNKGGEIRGQIRPSGGFLVAACGSLPSLREGAQVNEQRETWFPSVTSPSFWRSAIASRSPNR